MAQRGLSPVQPLLACPWAGHCSTLPSPCESGVLLATGRKHERTVGVRCTALALTRSHRPSVAQQLACHPHFQFYSKKTQSNNAENKRPEEDRESGRKANTAQPKCLLAPAWPGEEEDHPPAPSTVSHAPPPPGQPALSPQAPTLPSCCGAGPLQELLPLTRPGFLWLPT